MNYSEVDPNNKDHKRAHEYYAVTGHPRCHLKDDDVDIDIEYREYLAKKFRFNHEEDLCNGSTHIILNDNPKNYRMKIGFFYDDDSFGAEVTGELRYCEKTKDCVFFPQSEKRINVDVDSDFNDSFEMYNNRGAIDL